MLRPSSLVYLLFCLLLFNGCAASKKAKEAARQEAVKKEAEQKEAEALAKAPTPGEKLGVLVQAHPELIGKTTRIVHTTDTLVIKEATATAVIPVVSTATTDSVLIASLLQQLEKAGQLVNKAQANALHRSLLPELAKRPELSRMPVRVVKDGLEIEAWVDATGAVQVKTKRLQQQVGYPSAVWAITPQPVVVEQLTWWDKTKIAAKAYAWLLLFLLVLACFFIVRSIYRARKV